MSKRCPDCGFVNEDSRIYCGSCGELLDAELRLIKSLEAQKTSAPVREASPAPKSKPAPEPKPVPRPKNDDEDYDLGKMAQDKKSSSLPWILLAVGILVVVAGLLILNYAV